MSSLSLPPLSDNLTVVQGGGNAANALTCAARLGLKPRLISKVADDAQGRSILEELQLMVLILPFSWFLPSASNPFQEFLLKCKEAQFAVMPCDNHTNPEVSKEGNSPFTYIIVDNQTKTRTCIHTPGYPPMRPEELSESSLSSALDGTRLFYSDVRLHETALVVAEEDIFLMVSLVQAARKNIPILVDAEKKREGLDDLLNFSDYVVCSASFPQVR
ncbi:hypothetical protein CK203_008576 [Vitis vinifera]|uniref:Carbohydrate kinase PfkB domain-containing protein n=1 Tax=Vitis vinifera TaxID=29760 RepID=A0A438KDS7_VITVI|nr:hypothetical protein CK203_008576 [Vitis vinifera]